MITRREDSGSNAMSTATGARWLIAALAVTVLSVVPSIVRAQDQDSSAEDDQLYQVNDQFSRFGDSLMAPMYESNVFFDTTAPAWQWENPFPTGVHLYAVDMLFADSICAV